MKFKPALFLICVNETADTLPVLLQRRAFAINVLRREQQPLARRFAGKGGPDKFVGVEHIEGALARIPVRADAVAVIECELVAPHGGGDHRILIGKVRAARVHAGEPLLYYAGSYRGLAEAEERRAWLQHGRNAVAPGSNHA